MDHTVTWLHDHCFAGWGGDQCGYVAATLVLATFSMKSMKALRITAIVSNVAFLAYAISIHLLPIFVLHSLLLPLNIVRLIQGETNGVPASKLTIRRLLGLAKATAGSGPTMGTKQV